MAVTLFTMLCTRPQHSFNSLTFKQNPENDNQFQISFSDATEKNKFERKLAFSRSPLRFDRISRVIEVALAIVLMVLTIFSLALGNGVVFFVGSGLIFLLLVDFSTSILFGMERNEDQNLIKNVVDQIKKTLQDPSKVCCIYTFPYQSHVLRQSRILKIRRRGDSFFRISRNKSS